MDSLILAKMSAIVLGIAKVMGIMSMICIVFSCTNKHLAQAKPMIDLGILAALAGGMCWGIDKYLIS